MRTAGAFRKEAAVVARHLPANPSLEQLRKQAKEIRDHVRSGHPKAVKGARASHPRWGDTPLDAAEWAGFTLADAQLVVAREYGFASWRRLREQVELLVRYSASPQRRPANGADPVYELLRLACLTNCDTWNVGAGEEPDDPHRQYAARRLLVAHPELASATIHTAAAVGDVATVSELLAGDASLADQKGGPHGWPPLLYLTFSRLDSTAAGHSTLEAARLLLTHGADPNAGYLPDGEPPPVTALSGAFRGERDPVNQPAHQHSVELARLLLEAGADPNDERALRNIGGYPHDDDAGLALLLEYGLGRPSAEPWRDRVGQRVIEWEDHLGNRGAYELPPTPEQLVQTELRYSAQWNLPNRARLLLRRCAELGIDINTKAAAPGGRDPGQPAYRLAAVCGNTEIVDLLTRAGAQATPMEPIDQFLAACQRADRPAVDRLLAADPGLVERAVEPPCGPEPLHLAVVLNRPESVALMASIGFPINDDWHGWGTPLHCAALAGHLDVARLLVELGADPTAKGIDDADAKFVPQDHTPLGLARYMNHHEVAAYLARLTQ
jgi:ankyrin repeat protein